MLEGLGPLKERKCEKETMAARYYMHELSAEREGGWDAVAFVVILALRSTSFAILSLLVFLGLVGMNDIDNSGSQKKYALNLESWRI